METYIKFYFKNNLKIKYTFNTKFEFKPDKQIFYNYIALMYFLLAINNYIVDIVNIFKI